MSSNKSLWGSSRSLSFIWVCIGLLVSYGPLGGSHGLLRVHMDHFGIHMSHSGVQMGHSRVHMGHSRFIWVSQGLYRSLRFIWVYMGCSDFT